MFAPERAMSTLIQCPACSQKFNLQGKLPALFTCTKCQQPMDLTGFPGYVPEPAAPSPRALAAPERGGGRTSARRGGRRGRRDEDEDDDRRGRFEPKKNNTPLLVGGIVAVLAIVAVVIVVMSKKDEGGTSPAPSTVAGGSAAPGTYDPLAPVPPGLPGSVPGGALPGASAPGASGPGGQPPGAADPAAAKPVKPAGGVGGIKTWPTPDDVSKEDQQRIDQALETALNDVGISQRQAEDALVKLGRKAIWRLVSEFKHIQDTETFDSRKGKMHAMITDRILRKIDGYMERKSGYRMSINPESTLEYATGVAKKWNAWLETGQYKTELAPWDTRVDGQDEPTERPGPRGR
jgi:hypothetical protein